VARLRTARAKRLRGVAIPGRLRGFDSAAPLGQAFDVSLERGRVAAIVPAGGTPAGMLVSGFVDAHVHLDKTYSVEEVGAVHGDLSAAIARMASHRPGWTAAAIRPRMARALEDAWRCGTRAMRTHLDWVEPDPPASLAVFQALRREWAGRIALQFVSLTPLDLFDDADAAGRIAAAVARAGGVLGAFVYRNAGLPDKLQRLLELAARHRLAVDLHVDEGLDVEASGLRTVAALAIARGHPGRITCSHCCSLSVQPDADALQTLALCAEAGIGLVALPTTNLYLQGGWDRTPVPRGITRLREAAAHGIRPVIATDNVADGFYPYGSYDLLETFGLGVQLAHLAPATDWLDAVTVSPATAMALAWDGRIRVGCPADLVLLAARNEHELLTPAGRARTVYRDGRPR
jgi:cytosine/creatinine deaminase